MNPIIISFVTLVQRSYRITPAPGEAYGCVVSQAFHARNELLLLSIHVFIEDINIKHNFNVEYRFCVASYTC